MQRTQWPIQGFMYVPYIFGWITGIGNLIFWLVHIILYFSHNKGEFFFNNDFHFRTYVWGVVMLVLTGIFVVVGILALLFFVPVSTTITPLG